MTRRALGEFRERVRGGSLAGALILAGVMGGIVYRDFVRSPAPVLHPSPRTLRERAARSIPAVASPEVVAAAAGMPNATVPLEAAAYVRPGGAPAIETAIHPKIRESRHREISSLPPTAPAPVEAAPEPAPPATPLLPPPPALAEALPGGALPSIDGDILRPGTPHVADPFVSVVVAPAPERRHLLGKLFGKRRKDLVFVPPMLVREASVSVPRELRQRTQHEVPVDVKVYVDRSGKVEFAELLSNDTAASRDLATLAVFSTRHWEFSPAHLGDETVPGEVVIRFRFGRENR